MIATTLPSAARDRRRRAWSLGEEKPCDPSFGYGGIYMSRALLADWRSGAADRGFDGSSRATLACAGLGRSDGGAPHQGSVQNDRGRSADGCGPRRSRNYRTALLRRGSRPAPRKGTRLRLAPAWDAVAAHARRHARPSACGSSRNTSREVSRRMRGFSPACVLRTIRGRAQSAAWRARVKTQSGRLHERQLLVASGPTTRASREPALRRFR